MLHTASPGAILFCFYYTLSVCGSSFVWGVRSIRPDMTANTNENRDGSALEGKRGKESIIFSRKKKRPKDQNSGYYY